MLYCLRRIPLFERQGCGRRAAKRLVRRLKEQKPWQSGHGASWRIDHAVSIFCVKTDKGTLTAADLIRCRENIRKGVGRHKTEAATAEEMGTARRESWVGSDRVRITDVDRMSQR